MRLSVGAEAQNAANLLQTQASGKRFPCASPALVRARVARRVADSHGPFSPVNENPGTRPGSVMAVQRLLAPG
ncbi:MAG TPA: hypothetical protein PLO14_13235 [Accumulibacter sp.]|uniref:hypothetical protein n=1 Tax=Accumulibacter sp. TaxID=2053492 RepID=UPI0025F21AD4|nr:hypothetical protein [Accumulibacter sp.]MCM8597205.1 hypothetical protein [Accumulibacter sp.]MCM8661449.1 hypothetical protein [Accumulibacter sp.]HNC53179.1 hypothetical protein [Accumulibacter sp.]